MIKSQWLTVTKQKILARKVAAALLNNQGRLL